MILKGLSGFVLCMGVGIVAGCTGIFFLSHLLSGKPIHF